MKCINCEVEIGEGELLCPACMYLSTYGTWTDEVQAERARLERLTNRRWQMRFNRKEIKEMMDDHEHRLDILVKLNNSKDLCSFCDCPSDVTITSKSGHVYVCRYCNLMLKEITIPDYEAAIDRLLKKRQPKS